MHTDTSRATVQPVKRTLGGTLALTLILAIAGCGDDSDEPPPAADEEAMDEALADAGIPPEPDQTTADDYIAALDAINPGIVHGDIESAIDRGRNQCSTIQANPDDRAGHVESTNTRFTSPDAPDGWGPGIAAQILDVVHLFLCPDY